MRQERSAVVVTVVLERRLGKGNSVSFGGPHRLVQLVTSVAWPKSMTKCRAYVWDIGVHKEMDVEAVEDVHRYTALYRWAKDIDSAQVIPNRPNQSFASSWLFFMFRCWENKSTDSKRLWRPNFVHQWVSLISYLDSSRGDWTLPRPEGTSRDRSWAHFSNNIISRHGFKTIFFTNISSIRDSILGYKLSLKDSIFMVWSRLMWHFFHVASTWKSSL